MQPLIVTLTFLMLFSILMTGKMKVFFTESIKDQLNANYRQMQSQIQQERQISLLHEIKHIKEDSNEAPPPPRPKTPKEKKPSAPKKSPPLKFNLARPPDNSRLNLHVMLFENTPSKHYEMAAKLMRRLYGEADFFKKIPLLEYKILDALYAKRGEALNFAYPDDLATLNLGDPLIQEAFSTMLKGYIDCPSLLHYISFAGGSKINLMFAPKELLEAVIDNPQIATEVLKVREKIWEEIIYQEDHRKVLPKEHLRGRQVLKADLKAKITTIFTNYGSSLDPEKIFDLSLGKEGSIIIVTDPETLITTREKAITIK